MRLPRRVVMLGRLVEINFEGGDRWRPPNRSYDLCSSESGKTLWVFSVSKENRKQQPRSKLYEQFTGYYVSGIKVARIREPRRGLERSAKVKSIVYASNKWDNKMREYIHTFRRRPRAYSNNRDRPEFIKISGGNFRVKPEGITG